jgi:hypothetical protein
MLIDLYLHSRLRIAYGPLWAQGFFLEVLAVTRYAPLVNVDKVYNDGSVTFTCFCRVHISQSPAVEQ